MQEKKMTVRRAKGVFCSMFVRKNYPEVNYKNYKPWNSKGDELGPAGPSADQSNKLTRLAAALGC